MHLKVIKIGLGPRPIMAMTLKDFIMSTNQTVQPTFKGQNWKTIFETDSNNIIYLYKYVSTLNSIFRLGNLIRLLVLYQAFRIRFIYSNKLKVRIPEVGHVN